MTWSMLLLKKPLYWLHLAFTYGMVAAVAALMIGKMIRIPREYRDAYSKCNLSRI